MGVNILDVYEGMVKAAEEEAVVEEASAEEEAVINERVEIIAKYAAAADELLSDEYGKNYGEEDVEKLASMLLQHDVEQEEVMEKVAELDQAGRIMARAFKDELEKSAEKSSETSSEESAKE